MEMNKSITYANSGDHKSPNLGLENQNLHENGKFFVENLLIHFSLENGLTWQAEI